MGAEIDVRTKLEERICSTVFRDEDDRDLPKPPMVGLVVGGGPGTLFSSVPGSNRTHDCSCVDECFCIPIEA